MSYIRCFAVSYCLLIALLFLSELEGYAQSWKIYPYLKPGSKIEFPRDEGFHPAESLEWWYANGHLKGETTGHQYSFMIAYFHKPVAVFDGFRIFKITDETTHECFSQILPCIYQILSTDSLHIIASFLTGDSTEEWVNRCDKNGIMLPFQYLINAFTGDASMHLSLNAERPPLLIDNDGFLYQGSGNYTYYYSLTSLATNGSIIFGEVEEAVTGISWIDRQYGNFDPYEDESYEWFSIQLEENMDLNIWNIFTPENLIPDSREYRICSVIIDDTVSFTTHNFQVERLSYAFTPDSQRCYATSWKIVSDTMDMNLFIKVNDENNEINVKEIALRFFEGSIKINGIISNEVITGRGFTELLHSYENPILILKQPGINEKWNYQNPLIWNISNPDEGNPLKVDIEIEYQSKLFKKIARGLTDTLFCWNPAVFSHDSVFNVKITVYSTDTTLSDIGIRAFMKETENTDLFACTGVSFSINLHLDNDKLLFKWFYNGQISGFPEISALEISPVTTEAEGVYRCLVYNEFFEDTTIEYHLDVGFCNQIENNPATNLIIFPNPFKDYLSVKLPVKNEKYLLRIINLQGTVIYKAVLGSIFEETIHPAIKPGVYILSIATCKGDKSWIFKIIKS